MASGGNDHMINSHVCDTNMQEAPWELYYIITASPYPAEMCLWHHWVTLECQPIGQQKQMWDGIWFGFMCVCERSENWCSICGLWAKFCSFRFVFARHDIWHPHAYSIEILTTTMKRTYYSDIKYFYLSFTAMWSPVLGHFHSALQR